MTDTELDALVVGAGVAGLRQLHLLREQGLRVRAYDAADDVGGTWWWHYYPGARLDTEAHVYQYFFSRELVEHWGWSERFPGGYEVQRWLRFVADRLDLRRDIGLSTRIVSAHHDDARGRWTVRTDHGETIDTRFLVSCAGLLPAGPEIAGRDDFAGTVMRTSCWPEKGPDLAGRRVGVVGSGAAAVQLVPAVAERVAHLTVFAHDPPYVLPRANPMYGWQERDAYRSRFDELRATLPRTATGSDRDPEHVWADTSPGGRRTILDEAHRDGSRALWLDTFAGVGRDPEVTEGLSAYVRDRMRDRLADRRLSDVLVPADHGFGTRRVPLESGYLEVVGRADVDVVDLPIQRLVTDGVELADGTVHALDTVVLADEFDAGPGALTRVDVRGRDGRCLADEWRREVRTTLGLAVHGYPNLFTPSGPMGPSPVRCAMTTVREQQTEWVAGAVRDLLEIGGSVIEPTVDGEAAWMAHHAEVAGGTLSPHYEGGAGAYRQRCDDEAAAGYPAFTRT